MIYIREFIITEYYTNELNLNFHQYEFQILQKLRILDFILRSVKYFDLFEHYSICSLHFSFSFVNYFQVKCTDFPCHYLLRSHFLDFISGYSLHFLQLSIRLDEQLFYSYLWGMDFMLRLDYCFHRLLISQLLKANLHKPLL